MPNFSKDKSGFNMSNPMDTVGVKGESGKLPGMIGMRSDNPSPNKFLGKLFKGAKNAAKNVVGGTAKMMGLPGMRSLPGADGGGGGDLEGRVAALEAQSGGGGGAPAAGGVAAPEEPLV